MHSTYSISCNIFFMKHCPKCFWLKNITKIFLIRLIKKLWFFYKSKLKILVPISSKSQKIKLLWWKTLFNKRYANIVQNMCPIIFTPIDPKIWQYWGFKIWGHPEGLSSPYTTIPKMGPMGRGRGGDSTYSKPQRNWL